MNFILIKFSFAKAKQKEEVKEFHSIVMSTVLTVQHELLP